MRRRCVYRLALCAAQGLENKGGRSAESAFSYISKSFAPHIFIGTFSARNLSVYFSPWASPKADRYCHFQRPDLFVMWPGLSPSPKTHCQTKKETGRILNKKIVLYKIR